MTREPPDTASPFVLHNRAQAAVLLDARQRHSFAQFMGQENTVSKAARATGENANTMLRRVQRWKALGLLQATRAERHVRGTRLLYQAVADSFFLPHHATRHEDMLALVESVHSPPMARMRQAYARTAEALGGEWGVHFEVREGQFDMTPARSAGYRCGPADADAPIGLLHSVVLHLDEAGARALQVELASVIEKYRCSQGDQPYQVLVGLTQGEATT